VYLAPVVGAKAVAGQDTVSPGRVSVSVYGHSATTSAGIEGVLFSLARADGTSSAGSVQVSVNYSAFRGAYGADYASRLHLVELTGCSAIAPVPTGCTEHALQTGNDLGSGLLTATVGIGSGSATPKAAVGTASAAVLLAATPDASGGSGSFAATTLKPASTWSAGSSTGEFGWNYPLAMPPGLGGPTPQVALSYSSSAVDGEQATTNNQPSWIGEGFSYEPGYIERSYISCGQDMGGNANNGTATGDECWSTNNATLTLPGHGGGELLQDAADSNRWHMRTDDGTYIRHLTGAGNGAQNGEYWRLTTTDGTQYYFGSTSSANSTLTEPVYGNNPGEPCNQSTFAASSCTQAYRWNLDRIVDPSGNTVTFHYTKETNSYAADNNTGTLVSYDRNSYLTEIDYGTRTTSTGTAPIRVLFGTGPRCVTSSCSTHDATNWPDTPWDQQCTSTPCYTASPTFWSTVMLDSISTQLYSGTGSTYTTVNTWTLAHTFPDPGDGTRAGLWLSSIQQTGYDGGTTTSLPAVTFNSVQMANRVEPGVGLAPMNWLRVAQITTETGAEIEVSYSPPDCTPGTRMPDANNLQNNTYRCYPVITPASGSTPASTDYFNKYVVTQVNVADLTTPGQPSTTTSYQYLGNPAWHYTDDNGLVTPNTKTWSVWRGYGDVKTTVGTGSDASTSEALYFQGMDGDHLPSGTRSVQMPAVDLNGNGATNDAVDAPAQSDADAFAGMLREKIAWNGSAMVSATVDSPWESNPTATRTVSGITVNAVVTGTADTRTETVLDGGRAPRTSSTHTVFDPVYGLPTQVQDNGDDAVAGDETCTITGYDRNTSADGSTWLVNFPSRSQRFAVPCATAQAGGLSASQVVADTLTYYDGATSTATPPTQGHPTRVDSLKDWVASAPVYWTTELAQYDADGRVVGSTDARGNATTTSYTANAGGQVSGTTATTQLGWVTTTVLDPATGNALTVTDPNGRITAKAYDGLGRLIAGWQPGRDRATQSANVTYSYLIRNNAPTVVTANSLTPSGGYTTSYALYDGLLRQRQTQAPRGDGQAGALITDTLYDTAGRPNAAYAPYLASVTPGPNLFAANRQSDVPAFTLTQYDGAGRTTAATVYTNSTGTPQPYSTTTTAYGGDRVDVTPPTGGTATSTITDARGNTVELRQYHSATPTPFVAGSYDSTSYTYDARNQQTQVTDSSGNRWTTTYDLRGRVVATSDPNKGTASSSYDDQGDRISTTDARGVTLTAAYDGLGRQTALYQGAATPADELAAWTYDGLANSRGQLTKTTTYVGGAGGSAYSKSILGFTATYQPTAVSYSIPAAETGLAGTYTYIYTYNVDGSPNTTRVPTLDGGALPTETLTNGYTALGQASSLSTSLPAATTLVSSISYTGYGELAQMTMQTNGGSAAYLTRSYAVGSRTLAEQAVNRQTAPATVSDTRYTYDASGNPLSAEDSVSGDNQCYSYDYLDRLTAAWTPANGACSAAPGTAGLGGPAPYWTQWTFNAAGDRTGQVQNATPNGVATTTYGTPSAGSAQPHALTSASTIDGTGTHTAAYGYDQAGNATSRPDGAGGTQTLSWDPQGHLSTVTDANQSFSYVYDVDGSRLVSRDPTGSTLYLPGQELRYNPATGVKTTTRYYAVAGLTVAMRTTSAVTWLFSDGHGTTTTTLDAASQAVSTRYFDPYGAARGAAAGSWPAAMTRGFVGGVDDPTGLVHIGAREYDPGTGRFISTDPVVDPQHPQTLDSYAYSGDNPVTNSDPSGKRFVIDDGSGGNPIPDPQGPNVVATPVSHWWDFLNPVGDFFRQAAWETCGLTNQVHYYMREIAGYAQGAGVDPRLLMDFMINDNGAHVPGVPHIAAIEAFRSFLARISELRGHKGGSLGMTNVSESAWETAIATQKRDLGHSDLAGHDWRDLVDDPLLAIEAAAWVLRNVQDNLPTVDDKKGYTRNQLLAIGYNQGVGVMQWMAQHGSTPGQSGSMGATADQIKYATSYYKDADNQWSDVDKTFCHSGDFTCK
jgi:RHS repeat-associated protein